MRVSNLIVIMVFLVLAIALTGKANAYKPAERTAEVVKQERRFETCMDLRELASSTMRLRQEELSREDVLSTIPPSYHIGEMMVYDAFTYPLLSTATHKRDIIEMFASEYFMTCMKAPL